MAAGSHLEKGEIIVTTRIPNQAHIGNYGGSRANETKHRRVQGEWPLLKCRVAGETQRNS
jgi:hypothetical protein